MDRLIKSAPNGKLREVAPPGVLRFMNFSLLTLHPGESYSSTTGDSTESVLDLFGGTASVRIQGEPFGIKEFASAGNRADVFSGSPTMVYIPPKSEYVIKAASNVVSAGLFSAPSSQQTPPALVESEQVATTQAGRKNFARKVYTAIGANIPAGRLLVGETLNPPGNWSSYPPHKHDRSNPPQEAVLEEIYYFQIKPSQGFGFIWTYTAPEDPDGFNNVFVVEDGDTVLLPKGYHPVVAAPGYELHYTWALAGEERRYGAWADDPRHAWVKDEG